MNDPATRPRLILFGIDGGTFDIIEPAVEAGQLPTIGRLMKEGSWRVLNSIVPPITGAAWPTIMTGVNPGKHGVFEFATLQKDSYLTRMTSSADRKTLAIWQLLNQSGLRVGVLNVPITYPAEPLEGWMVSGMMGAPELNESACYPTEIIADISSATSDYPMLRRELVVGGEGTYRLDRLEQQVQSRAAATLRLLRQHPVDVVIVVCSYTDHVQHLFWKKRSLTTPDGQQIEDMVLYAYQRADEQLAELLAFCGEQTTTFIISDHGFGPLEGGLNMDRFLLDSKLMVSKADTVDVGNRGLGLVQWIRNRIPDRLLARLPRSWYRRSARVFQSHRLGRIDWPQSRALNIGSYLGLRLNVKGREPQGCIPEEEYEEQRNEIRQFLDEFRHPFTDAPVFDVNFREELYHGPYASDAPDLTGLIGDGKIRLMRRPDPRGTHGFLTEEEVLRADGRSGLHQMNGILIAGGPNLKPGRLPSEAQLVDVVPTVLYALGLPVPAYCDGQVLTDMFAGEFVRANPTLQTEAEMHREARDTQEDVYSAEQEEQVKKRLRDLGYLD